MSFKSKTMEFISVWLYFLIAFALLSLTQSVILNEYGFRRQSSPLIVGEAFVVARALTLLERTRFLKRYDHKPLIFSVLWKTPIYLIGVFILRYLSDLLKLLLFAHDSWTMANQKLTQAISESKYWVIQLWLVLLILTYCFVKEVIHIVGFQTFNEIVFRNRYALSRLEPARDD
jgi:hypothetical protein